MVIGITNIEGISGLFIGIWCFVEGSIFLFQLMSLLCEISDFYDFCNEKTYKEINIKNE